MKKYIFSFGVVFSAVLVRVLRDAKVVDETILRAFILAFVASFLWVGVMFAIEKIQMKFARSGKTAIFPPESIS